MSTTNLEEAANIASEFVSSECLFLVSVRHSAGSVATRVAYRPHQSLSEHAMATVDLYLPTLSGLENLPAEVQHLLAEMKHRDIKSQGMHTLTLHLVDQ